MYVRNGNSKVQFDLPLSATLESLKQGIQEQLRIPKEEQKIFFGGKQLLDETRSLNDYNISSTNTLLLIQQTNLNQVVHLSVKTLKEDYVFHLTMVLSDKVKRIRKLLQERFPLPKSTLIVYKGLTLDNDKALLDYNIQDNSVVYIVSKVVLEVENSRGQRMQMSITDPEMTGTIVEKLTQRDNRPQEANRSKRRHSQVDSPTPLKKVKKLEEFGGLKKGFLSPPSAPPLPSLPPLKTDLQEIQKKPNAESTAGRCGKCNKKVGLTPIKCRCGNIYCAQHRYAEAHACSFDYKGTCRQELTKQNPKIAGEKLTKIL